MTDDQAERQVKAIERIADRLDQVWDGVQKWGADKAAEILAKGMETDRTHQEAELAKQ